MIFIKKEKHSLVYFLEQKFFKKQKLRECEAFEIAFHLKFLFSAFLV
jgi:hypothetical protein